MQDSYDYNATYGPLHVYNQATEPDCVPASLCLAACATIKAYTGDEPLWNGDPKALQQGGFQPDGSYIDWYAHLSDGMHTLRNPGALPSDQAAKVVSGRAQYEMVTGRNFRP